MCVVYASYVFSEPCSGTDSQGPCAVVHGRLTLYTSDPSASSSLVSSAQSILFSSLSDGQLMTANPAILKLEYYNATEKTIVIPSVDVSQKVRAWPIGLGVFCIFALLLLLVILSRRPCEKKQPELVESRLSNDGVEESDFSSVPILCSKDDSDPSSSSDVVPVEENVVDNVGSEELTYIVSEPKLYLGETSSDISLPSSFDMSPPPLQADDANVLVEDESAKKNMDDSDMMYTGQEHGASDAVTTSECHSHSAEITDNYLVEDESAKQNMGDTVIVNVGNHHGSSCIIASTECHSDTAEIDHSISQNEPHSEAADGEAIQVKSLFASYMMETSFDRVD